MKLHSFRWITLTTALAALGLSTNAHAIWNLNQSAGTNASPTTISATVGAGETTTSISGSPTVQLSGFAVQNSGYSTSTQTGGTSGGFNTGAAGQWAANNLTLYSGNGQGMTSSTSDAAVPNHALDNNGYTEGVLLSFGASVVLSSIGLGYTSNKTYNSSGALIENGTTQVDLSVFRWTGSVAPVLAGTAASTMAGWELVGNYGDMIYDVNNPYNLVNGGAKGSSYWLITAYNSGFTQSSGAETRGTLDNGNDYFKLYAVAGTQCTSKVTGICGGTNIGTLPEPATLALTSVALVGVAGLRRRQSKTIA